MKDLVIRKITTNSSNNEWYAFFERGKLGEPLFMLDECALRNVITDLCIEAQEIVEEQLKIIKNNA